MMTRRGLLDLFRRGVLAAAASRIPVVSTVSKKVAERCGWICLNIKGKKIFVPFWS